MLDKLLGTTDDVSATILRITLGLVILPHGAQKLLGWFGGYGFAGTMHHSPRTWASPTSSRYWPFWQSLSALSA